MLILVIAAVLAAPPVSNACLDDDHNNRCSPARQAEMRALYRVPPIEAYSGATVRRVFFVDGYGNDTVAIEFVRAAGKDPLARVNFPKVKSAEPIAPIEGALSAEQWQQIIESSEHFDRKFASKYAPRAGASRKGKNNEDEGVALCLHSWVYWAEAIDRQGPPRSTVDDACNDQPVEQFAWFAARHARQSIPYCAALDKQFSRNDATLLRTCSLLTGDRLAAAEVWNRAKGFRSLDTPGGLDELPAYDFALDYQGKKLTHDQAKAFWRSLMAAQNSPQFYYDSVHGLNADRVVVTGELNQLVGDDLYQTADIEIQWQRDGGTLNVESIKVGQYRPVILPNG